MLEVADVRVNRSLALLKIFMISIS